MMIRRAVALILALAATPAFAGEPVVLKSRPAAANAITLADLFEGATGPAAKTVVAPAPAPGMNAVLDAGRVQLAAKAAGFEWDNPMGVRRVIVASTAAGAAPAGAAAAAGPRRAAQALVYARNIAAGEIVGAADLVWSSDAIAPSNAPGDPDKVIGMAARRPLREGAATMISDLSAPVAVKRDETITVAFESGGISLSLQGKAMKDAAVGDSVQVMNLQSKKTIEAVVAGPGRAVVGPAAQALKARGFTTASLR